MKKLKLNYSNDKTFEEGCKEYLDYCRGRNLRDGTLRHYRDSIKSICRFIEPSTLIFEIDNKRIQKFIIDCKENLDIKDITLYTYCRDLRTLMYYFMECEYIESYKIKIIKADKEPIETYSDKELEILLKKPDLKKCSFSHYKAWVMISFLLSTGIRMNSLRNILIKDIDFDNEVIVIRVTKNRKTLILPLNRTIIKILKSYLKVRQHTSEDEYLFCNVFGKQLTKSTMYSTLYQYHKAKGIDKTGVHRYRHTFAKKWITSGGNVVTLQKVLGHSSLAITQNYLNILTCDIKKEMDEINILEEFTNNFIKL